MNPAFLFFSNLSGLKPAAVLLRFCGIFLIACGFTGTAASGQETKQSRQQSENFIRQQILESEPLKAQNIAPLKTQEFISPQAHNEKTDNRQKSGAPYLVTQEDRAQSPVITAPIPIPVPKFIPVPVPNPSDAIAPQAAPYEAQPDAPLYHQDSAAQIEDSHFFPRFGDRKPHIWTSRHKPWHYAIHGTDVSWHNKSLDWSEMARGHISFVFIKATEGGDFVDPAFMQNWQAAKAAGIARGAYHFYYFCRPAKDQLRWFIRNVPRDKTALPPILDMEWNRASTTCRHHPDPAIVHWNMRLFLRGLEKHYGKKPIIYTTVDFFHDNDLGRYFGAYPFWLRSVADHPDERYNNHPWLFWQYTGTGRVPGIAGDADISVFSGDRQQWQAWLHSVRR